MQAKNAGKVNYENRVLPSNITWWTSKGYNEFDAIKEQQKFYKEKYSVTRKNCPSYDNMMKNRQNTWASKSSEERAEINKTRGKTFDELVQKFGIKKALSIIDKRNAAFKTKNWSKISKQCFIKIEKLIADKCYYAENEKLFYVNKKRYYADFSYKNIIIEFNGDIFHANPDIYTATDHPNPYAPHLTAQDIWLNDMKRKTAFESAGFSYYVIWENDYNNSKHIATEMYEKIKTKII
ncbi:MAG: hypothetical protein M0R51_05535 [Clostridia bacterium]|nr:hypothetical protein [Clostridia bacterium]